MRRQFSRRGYFLVLLSSSLALGCWGPHGLLHRNGASATAPREARPAPPAPAPSESSPAGAPATPPAVARALAGQKLKNFVASAAALKASGAPDTEVEEQTQRIAWMVQVELEYEVDPNVIMPSVQRAIEEASRTPEARRRGAIYAAQRPFQARLKATPAVQRAIDGESAAIAQAAQLRNVRDTQARADELAQQIAKRVEQKAADGTPSQMVLAAVYAAISRQQMQLMFGKEGPVKAVLKRQAQHAEGPMGEMLKRVSTPREKPDPNLFNDAYAGRPESAVRFYRDLFEQSENGLRLQSWQSSEHSNTYRQLLIGMSKLNDSVLTLAERNPQHDELTRLAYSMLLAYRAKSPEVERRIGAALSELRDDGAKEARAHWRDVRQRIAALELQRASGVTLAAGELAELTRMKESERSLQQRLVEYTNVARGADKPFDARTSITDLQARLRPDEAVVSFAEYRHVRPDDIGAPNRWKPNYGAFLLTSSGFSFVPLGAGPDVDGRVGAYLDAIAEPTAALTVKRRAAFAVYESVFARLEPKLKGVAKLRVIADGALQLLPFEALHDSKSWLTDRFEFSYSESERQLLGEYRPPVDAAPPLVLVPGPHPVEPKPLRSGQKLSQEHFPQLNGAASEGQRVHALLPAARLLVGGHASEGVLFEERSPSVLHIAAHGVFLPFRAGSAAGRGLVLEIERERASSQPEDVDPMFRSALVLAADSKQASDGFLTAFEAAGASLWGTQLVVLSACQTGRGAPDRISGLRGLRRAFFTAGAQSLVTSLWSVSDLSSAELMQRFYEQLKAGAGRGEALRKASASVRAKQEDPHFWAPFILLGDARPLDWSASAASSRPNGEDPESRLQRAMLLKRLRHSVTRVGNVGWVSGSARHVALDTYVRRERAARGAQLVLRFLDKQQLISAVVNDYRGPGRYTVQSGACDAGSSPVKDPLAVEIQKQSPATMSSRASAGEIEVARDTPSQGLHGKLSLRFKDGSELTGQFALESSEPDVPEVFKTH